MQKFGEAPRGSPNPDRRLALREDFLENCLSDKSGRRSGNYSTDKGKMLPVKVPVCAESRGVRRQNIYREQAQVRA